MNTDMILVAAISAVGGIIGGSGGAEAIKGLLGRKPSRVVAVDNDVKLAQQAAAQAKQSADYAQQMEQSARAAWTAANQAEERTIQINRQAQERIDGLEKSLDDVQFRLSMVSRYMVWLFDLIGNPDTSIESLRRNVAVNKPPAGVLD